MSERPSMFEDAIDALAYTRRSTIAEADNIPDEDWGYRPHPDANSVTELVRHIVEATAMLVGEATDPEGDFSRRPPEEHVRAHLGELPEEMSPAELRRELAQSHDANVRRIRDAGEGHMATGVTRFDGGTWSRLTYVFYAASHEDYHRGQLATYARALGLVPALTQLIQSKRS